MGNGAGRALAPMCLHPLSQWRRKPWIPLLHGMLFNWDHSINVDKAISDLSDRRFVMIVKIVESSAYFG